jgi:hypothetical protein
MIFSDEFFFPVKKVLIISIPAPMTLSSSLSQVLHKKTGLAFGTHPGDA